MPTAIESDLQCIGCGYNLRGLDADGLCPECGNPVQISMEHQSLGDGGSFWLSRLMAGVLMLAALYGFSMAREGIAVLRGFRISAARDIYRFVNLPQIGIAFRILWMLAIYWLTAVPRMTREFHGRLRRLVRYTTLILGMIDLVLVILMYTGFMNLDTTIYAVVAAIIFLPIGWLQWTLIGAIARRIPADGIAAQAMVLRWIKPMAALAAQLLVFTFVVLQVPFGTRWYWLMARYAIEFLLQGWSTILMAGLWMRLQDVWHRRPVHAPE